MKAEYHFSYYRDVIPPRCRKPRTTCFEDGVFTVEITNLDELELKERERLFPLAFQVHGKLYEANAIDRETTDYRGYSPTHTLYVPSTTDTIQSVLRKNWSGHACREEIEADILQWAKSILIYDGLVWRPTEYEPCYQIVTFGSGDVSVMVETASPGQSNNMSIYRADELELAKNRAIKMAECRGDQRAVEMIRDVERRVWRIDVFRLEFSRLLTYENREAQRLMDMVNHILVDKLEYTSEEIPPKLRQEVVQTCWRREGFREQNTMDMEKTVLSTIRSILNREF